MKKLIALLLVLSIILCLCACSADTATPEEARRSPSHPTLPVDEDPTSEVIKVAINRSVLTAEYLSGLSWNEISALVGDLSYEEIQNNNYEKLSWTPGSDEDIGLLTVIRCLNGMGKVFCTTHNARPSFMVKTPESYDHDCFTEKLNIIMKSFEASEDTFWYVHARADDNRNLLNLEIVESVDIYLSATNELFIKELKHPPVKGDLVVAVTDGYSKSEHPEHFGKGSIYSRDGKCGDILEVVDVVTIAGMELTFDGIEFDMDYDADTATLYSMLKLSTQDGSETFYSWAPDFIPLDVAKPFMPASDAE